MADNGDERKHATEDAPCADPAEPADENSRKDDSEPIDPPDNSGGGGLADSEPTPMEDGYMAMDDD